jgi:hypothetical protein
MFKAKEPEPELSLAEKAARHQQQAEAELVRAGKAGRLEAETVHATRATAHATLALGYLIEARQK